MVVPRIKSCLTKGPSLLEIFCFFSTSKKLMGTFFCGHTLRKSMLILKKYHKANTFYKLWGIQEAKCVRNKIIPRCSRKKIVFFNMKSYF